MGLGEHPLVSHVFVSHPRHGEGRAAIAIGVQPREGVTYTGLFVTGAHQLMLPSGRCLSDFKCPTSPSLP